MVVAQSPEKVTREFMCTGLRAWEDKNKTSIVVFPVLSIRGPQLTIHM